MKIDVHSVTEIPRDVLDAWAQGRLAQDRFSNFTGGYDWFRMMVAHQPNDACVVSVRDSEGHVNMVVPLQRWSRRMGWKTIRTMKVVGGEGIVGSRLSESESVGIWEKILGQCRDCDALWIGHVADARVSRYYGNNVLCYPLFTGLPHYRLILPDTLDALWAMRSKGSIKKIFGRERAMARDTGKTVRLVELRTASDVAPYRAAIDAMMSHTWQSRSLGHGFDGGGLDQLAEWGWLRCFVLLLGDEPVAYAHGYQGEGVYVYAQIGYADTYATYSPGTILLYRLLEYFYTVNDRPLCVDFGEGEGDYKRHLANDRQLVSSVMLVRKSASLYFYFRALTVLGKVKRLFRHAAKWMTHEDPVSKT